jgi:hypothetical protein
VSHDRLALQNGSIYSAPAKSAIGAEAAIAAPDEQMAALGHRREPAGWATLGALLTCLVDEHFGR